MNEKPTNSILTAVGAPARRALERAGLVTAAALAERSEAEILALHGVGPSSLPRLRAALAAEGLAFRPGR